MNNPWKMSAAMIAGVAASASFAQVPDLAPTESTNLSEDVLPRLCASDPDYQFFERIQAEAFREFPEFTFLLDPKTQKKLKLETLDKLRTGNSADNLFKLPPAIRREIESELNNASAPTCYENPNLFGIIRRLAGDMDIARQQLGLTIKSSPKFGSIPSTDINAYTFTPTADRAGIIAINVQIFNFALEMTQLIVPTIEGRATSPTSEDAGTDHVVHIMADLYSNPQLRGAFEEVILGFSKGSPIRVRKDNPVADPFAVFLDGSMERFVFAHEFGHVLLKHKPLIGTLPGAPADANHRVLSRSWKQEFEADAMGVKLLTMQWRSMSRQYPKSAPYWLYAAKASLFFLACMEVIDEANYARDHGAYRKPPTEAEVAHLRDYSTGQLSDKDLSNTGYDIATNHPPAWLRLERARDALDNITKRLRVSDEENRNSKRADEAIANLLSLWDFSKRSLLTPLTSAQ